MNSSSAFSLFPPEENRFYAFMALLIYVFTRLYFRLEVYGAEKVPRSGPLLLVANHASNLDPTTIACGLPRQAHFLAKEELFRKRGLGSFLPHVNTHAIRRGGSDRAAIKQCVDLLREGKMLLVFPEGTRTPDGELQEGKPGAAMIGLQSEALICPAYIDGTFEAMPRGVNRPRRAKVRVFLGDPFQGEDVVTGLDRRQRYEILGKVMMERIAELQKRARQVRDSKTEPAGGSHE